MTPRSRLKDPRIVPVWRAFGGKDRHSKVYTVKGLRDRRVRLSVPTAIQLYDLQARLGLDQPSKVVDWLLNVAKHDIDELPPLQIPPGNFGENHVSQELGLKINHGVDWDYSSGLPRSNLWNFDATTRDKSKEISIEMDGHKDSWNQNRNEEEKQGVVEVHVANVSPTKFFPRPNHAFVPGLLNKITPHKSFDRLIPSNFPSPQTEDFSNFNFVPFPLTSSLLSFGSQVLVRPPGIAQSDHFPYSHVELDPKQINHFHTLISNSPSQLVYSLGQSTRPLSLETGDQSHSINDVEFPPK